MGCTCEAGFQGADCSLRTCPFGTSWATTAQGDVNHDGNTNGVTVYRSDIEYRDSTQAYVIDQRTKQAGTWERWPSHFTSGKDEGHFYMECSNRGTCDRKTGECVCFDGYTGEACRRTVCPTTTNEDCSGHGTCETVKDLVAEDSSTTEAYKLWDGEMSRACKCDPGYSGIDCANRLCPKGDDPLTARIYNAQTADWDQGDETQYVRVYANDPSKDLTDKATTKIGGSFSLKYTDYYGQEWETDQVAVKPYWELASASEVSSTETAVANALKGIPNGVISDVSVVAQPCALVVQGDVTAMNDCSELTDGSSYICGNDFTSDAYFSCNGASAVAYGSAVSAGSAGTCHTVSSNCVRFKITFTGNPGRLNLLSVNTASVTVNGKTHSQDDSTGITSLSHGQLPISDNDITAAYSTIDADGTGSIFCDASGGAHTCSTTAGNVQITLDTAQNAHTTLCTACRVRITCGTLELGTYTVAAVASDGSTVDFDEKLTKTCSNNDDLRLDLKTAFATVNADFTAYMFEGDVFSHNLNIIDKVYWGSETYEKVILFKEDTSTSSDLNPGSADIRNYGTKESSECSDRGVCDGATGECNCFQGYTGAACSEQNELAI